MTFLNGKKSQNKAPTSKKKRTTNFPVCKIKVKNLYENCLTKKFSVIFLGSVQLLYKHSECLLFCSYAAAMPLLFQLYSLALLCQAQGSQKYKAQQSLCILYFGSGSIYKKVLPIIDWSFSSLPKRGLKKINGYCLTE